MARLQAQKQLHVVAVEAEFSVHELGRNDGKTSSRPQQPFTKGIAITCDLSFPVLILSFNSYEILHTLI